MASSAGSGVRWTQVFEGIEPAQLDAVLAAGAIKRQRTEERLRESERALRASQRESCQVPPPQCQIEARASPPIAAPVSSR